MKSLIIERRDYTPQIHFDTSNNHFKISGESSSEDSNNFYMPIIEWVENFLKRNEKPILFDIHLLYYNTNASQIIFEILEMMNKHAGTQHVSVEVNWYVASHDIDMIEDGEDLREDFTNLTFNILEEEEV